MMAEETSQAFFTLNFSNQEILVNQPAPKVETAKNPILKLF